MCKTFYESTGKKIQIINGPNLNLLGKREQTVYGNASFEGYLSELRAKYPQCEIAYFQSNVEGDVYKRQGLDIKIVASVVRRSILLFEVEVDARRINVERK